MVVGKVRVNRGVDIRKLKEAIGNKWSNSQREAINSNYSVFFYDDGDITKDVSRRDDYFNDHELPDITHLFKSISYLKRISNAIS